MDTVLGLTSLEKTYRPGLFRRSVPALQGLSLSVRRGEIYGFVGPNGAGKTTTFKIVLGLLRASAGSGSLMGRPLGDRQTKRRLGFLPELPAYPPHLTVAETLRLARDLSGAGRDDHRDRRLLEELGLDLQASRRVGRLSKGQLQRVGLAQALVHRPEFLILDEPMSGLDPLGRSLVKERLRAERAAGRTILLSSHVLSDVEALADRVGIAAEGRLLAEGSPSDLLSGTAAEVVIEGSGALPEDLLSGMPPGSIWSPLEASASRRGGGDRSGEVGSGSDRGGSWMIRLPKPEPMQVDGCLRRILRAGGEVRRVETIREDLEAFFVRRLTTDMSSERRSA